MPGTNDLLAEILRALEKQDRREERTQQGVSGGPGDALGGFTRRLGQVARDKETSLLARGTSRIGDVAKGRAFGGGAAGLAASAGLGLAGGVAGLAGQGLVAASQGGTFSGGAARSALGAAAKIPILGELSGAAPAARIAAGAQTDLNQITNQVARFAGAGAVTPRIRGFLARTLSEQNKNIEQDRQANTAAVNAELGTVTKGQGVIPELIASLGQLSDTIGRLNGSSGGASQHT